MTLASATPLDSSSAAILSSSWPAISTRYSGRGPCSAWRGHVLGDGEVQGHAQAMALLQQHLHDGQGCLNGRQLVHRWACPCSAPWPWPGSRSGPGRSWPGCCGSRGGRPAGTQSRMLAVGGLINGSQGPGADGADLGEHLGCHVGGGTAGILALDLLHQGGVLLGEVLLIALDLAGVAGYTSGRRGAGSDPGRKRSHGPRRCSACPGGTGRPSCAWSCWRWIRSPGGQP